MAFVDLSRDKLILKVVLAGPPAVGKTERLMQIAQVGRHERYGSSLSGQVDMALLAIAPERGGREVEVEVYEWHGPEKADLRGNALFVGLDGLVYIADARQDRKVDSIRQFEFLVERAGKSKIQRLPGLLLLGRKKDGLFRLSSFGNKFQGPTWSDQLELEREESEPFIEALRVFAEVMMARTL